MNHPGWNRAEAEHLEPDEPEFDECEACEGSGVEPQIMDGEPDECSCCDGFGYISEDESNDNAREKNADDRLEKMRNDD